ncbi:hypothetical protein L6V77_04635 [Myxococcota bacterium]|jgi:hypothetical protein|nr:hypothetical protein [Myxococcota bacterium]
MTLAFVGPAGATPARLEELLLALTERRAVEAIVPVGAAQGEIAAVLRSRERRFPVEVPWTSPDYPDFVLSAVLDGLGAQPAQPEEQLRNQRLAQLVRRIGRGAVHFEVEAGRRIAVAQDESQAPTDVALVVVAAPGPGLDRPAGGGPGRARLRPAGMTPDGRLVAAEVAGSEAGLEVRFVDASGEVLRVERL